MPKNQIVIETEKVTNTCFVVMPFHPLFEAEYERVIRPAIEETGLKCIRGDEIYTEQAIVQDIWRFIRQARVIVAELSGRNPNVMYEIGLAHAIGKPIILITRKEEDVPFDLRALRYIYYDPNNPFWGEDLCSELTKVVQKVIETPSLSAHLNGIKVMLDLPEFPERPVSQAEFRISDYDFSGVWNTSWLSIQKQREHKATLVIPPKHGRNFAATMTVVYLKDEKQTIVQETLAGTARELELSLTGVNYTYVERGNSYSYSLDSFELRLAEDGLIMKGRAILRHGTRDIVFQKMSDHKVESSTT